MSIWHRPYVTWRGTQIGGASGVVRSASVAFGTEGVDNTASGHYARSSASGLRTAAVSMELNWGAGSTTAVDHLFGSTVAQGIGTSGALVIRETTAAISASNPQYTFTARVANYEFGGSIGDQHVATVDLENAGSAIARAIST